VWGSHMSTIKWGSLTLSQILGLQNLPHDNWIWNGRENYLSQWDTSL